MKKEDGSVRRTSTGKKDKKDKSAKGRDFTDRKGKARKKDHQLSQSDSSDSGDQKRKKSRTTKKKQAGRQISHSVQLPDDVIMLYPDIENPIEGPVKISREPTHTAPQVKIMDDGLTVMNEKGYRMAKAAYGVWEGYWCSIY